MISPHATAKEINVLKARRRLAPLGYDLGEFTQFVHLQEFIETQSTLAG